MGGFRRTGAIAVVGSQSHPDHRIPRKWADMAHQHHWAVDAAELFEAGSPLAKITTLRPKDYSEARTIGEQFREGIPVIMNLTEMDDADAKRLVDFAAGLIFGLRGTIERVTSKVFLLCPRNVNVTPEDKARIASGGFFNQS